MSARDLYCPVCHEWRDPTLMESDACSLCKIALDAEMAAVEDTAAVARAYGENADERTHCELVLPPWPPLGGPRDFAPPAVPLTCGCGQPAIAQRGGVALCGAHLTTPAPERTAA